MELSNLEQVFESGTKFDGQKLEMHYLTLIPEDVLVELGKVYEVGIKTYGFENWKKGFVWSRIFSAALRHLWKFWKLSDYDEDTGLCHLAQASWNIMTLLWMFRNMKGIDDRKKVEKLVATISE